MSVSIQSCENENYPYSEPHYPKLPLFTVKLVNNIINFCEQPASYDPKLSAVMISLA